MSRPVKLLIAFIILIALPVGFYIYFKKMVDKLPAMSKEVPTFWAAPYFKYADTEGDSLSSDDLKGFIYAADFIFTNCEGVCPDLSKSMSNLQKTFEENQRIKLVTFSIDPDRDSLPALRDYAKRYEATKDKWYFLRGDKSSIWDVVEKGFKVSVGYAPDSSGTGYSFTHSEKIVLVDQQGMIRGFYNGLDANDIDSLNNNIAKLIMGLHQ